MTSLIFGSIYLAHQAATGHYRDKQRRKNYERWEGLGDEYDAQKKITRETRSLDIQRTGTGTDIYDDQPIVSLRDLQEANDARTSWRPQEGWEQSQSQAQTQTQARFQPQPTAQLYPPSQSRHSISESRTPSTTSTSNFTPTATPTPTPSLYWQSRGEIRPQRTGSTWDDGLPQPLKVSRRSFDSASHESYNAPRNQRHDSAVSMSSSSLSTASPGSPFVQSVQEQEQEPEAMNSQFLQQLSSSSGAVTTQAQPPVPVPVPMQSYFMDNLKQPLVAAYSVPQSPHPYSTPYPHTSSTPAAGAGAGGRMAELIERGY